MSKRISSDLDRAVKAIWAWEELTDVGRLDFHTQRQEQRMIELRLNFVSRYHKQISEMITTKGESRE